MGSKPARRTTTPVSSVACAALMQPNLATGAGPARLEAQIVGDPDDLDVRRVLSDALVDAGDPRGEYLRLGLLADELPDWEPQREPVARAARTLQARYARTWTRALASGRLATGTARWGERMFDFARGAVEILRGSAAELIEVLDAARAVAPICELRVDLHDQPLATARELAAMPGLAAVRRLDISGVSVSATGVAAALLASPHLARLDRLRISGGLDRTLAAAIAAMPAVAGLAELSLTGAPGVGPAGVEEILDAITGGRLRRLRLDAQELGAAGVRRVAELAGLDELALDHDRLGRNALADVPGLAGLRRLSLAGTRLDERDAAALVAGPAFPRLVELDLSGCALNSKRIVGVLEAFALPTLRRLGLAGNALRLGGAQALAASRALAQLTALDLSSNGFKDDGAAALAGAAHLPHLTRLELSGNGIGAPGMGALADGPLLSGVTDLALRNNKCQTAGGQELARWADLPRLRRLSLYYNWMGVRGLRALLERMEDAEELHLDENNYGVEPVRGLARSSVTRLHTLSTRDAGAAELRAFAESPAAANLETLSLSVGHVDQAAAAALAALPGLGELHLSFCEVSDPARDILVERLGPFLTWWPPAG